MTAASLQILSGARMGDSVALDRDFVTLGRHPTSHVAFDPERDLEVSVRHAALFRHEGRWMLRDLGSRNGTFLNGARIYEDREVEPGDRIRFGPLGPEAALLVGEGASAAISLPTTHEQPAAPESPPLPSSPNRVSADVARWSGRWARHRLVGVGVLLVILIGGYRWMADRSIQVERMRLVGEVDSLLQILAATQTEATAVQGALADVIASARAIRHELTQSAGDPDRLDRLSHAVGETRAQQDAVLKAARFDPAPLVEANIEAVGLVVAQFEDGQTFTSTGFVAATAGDTGWVFTSRHAVTDSLIRPAQQVGFVFHGSGQLFRATIEAVHDSLDVATLRVVVRGGMPAVDRQPNAEVKAGDPVVLLGFPQGLDLPMGGDWRVVGVTASTFLGSISRSLPTLLQVDGYGATGSSGSPIVSANGGVIGMVYGGERGTGGRVLYGLPLTVAEALIPAGRSSGQ